MIHFIISITSFDPPPHLVLEPDDLRLVEDAPGRLTGCREGREAAAAGIGGPRTRRGHVRVLRGRVASPSSSSGLQRLRDVRGQVGLVQGVLCKLQSCQRGEGRGLRCSIKHCFPVARQGCQIFQVKKKDPSKKMTSPNSLHFHSLLSICQQFCSFCNHLAALFLREEERSPQGLEILIMIKAESHTIGRTTREVVQTNPVPKKTKRKPERASSQVTFLICRKSEKEEVEEVK